MYVQSGSVSDRESTKTISTKSLMVFHKRTIVKIGFRRLGYIYIYIYMVKRLVIPWGSRGSSSDEEMVDVANVMEL